MRQTRRLIARETRDYKRVLNRSSRCKITLQVLNCASFPYFIANHLILIALLWKRMSIFTVIKNSFFFWRPKNGDLIFVAPKKLLGARKKNFQPQKYHNFVRRKELK